MTRLLALVRRPGPAVVAVLAVLATSTALACAGGGALAAARTVRCPRGVTAGGAPNITLRAFGLAATGLPCSRARTIVGAFLDRKLHQASERCAGRAENPPYRGCVVDGYRCRETGKGVRRHGREVVGQLCTDKRRRVRFKETDRSAS